MASCVSAARFAAYQVYRQHGAKKKTLKFEKARPQPCLAMDVLVPGLTLDAQENHFRGSRFKGRIENQGLAFPGGVPCGAPELGSDGTLAPRFARA